MARKRQTRPKGRKRQLPTGTHHGRALSDMEKEAIRQVFLLTGNKTETARQTGVSVATVANVLKNSTTDPELKKARAKSAVEMAGKVHDKVNKVLDSIGDDDMESGYLKDDEGEIRTDRQGRPIWLGPTLNQKVLSMAILADKLPVLESYRAALEDDRQQGVLPLPEDVSAAIDAVKGKLKSLSILNVQFQDENQELAQRAQDLLKKAERMSEEQDKAVEADYEVLDFDVPGESHD